MSHLPSFSNVSSDQAQRSVTCIKVNESWLRWCQHLLIEVKCNNTFWMQFLSFKCYVKSTTMWTSILSLSIFFHELWYFLDRDASNPIYCLLHCYCGSLLQQSYLDNMWQIDAIFFHILTVLLDIGANQVLMNLGHLKHLCMYK